MIVALLTLLLLGGSSTYIVEAIDFYEGRTEELIPKGERRNQAKAIFKSMDDAIDRRHDALESTAKQLDKLLQDKDVPDADLDAVLSYAGDAIETYHRETLDLRFKLKDVVNREEWQAIFSTPPNGG